MKRQIKKKDEREPKRRKKNTEDSGSDSSSDSSSEPEPEKLLSFKAVLSKGKRANNGKKADADHPYIDMVVQVQFDVTGGHDIDNVQFQQLATDAYRLFATTGLIARESTLGPFEDDKYDRDSFADVPGKKGTYRYFDTPGWSPGVGVKLLSTYHIFGVQWKMRSVGKSLLGDGENKFFIPFVHVDGEQGEDCLYPDSTIEYSGGQWTFDDKEVFTSFEAAASYIVEQYKDVAGGEEWVDLTRKLT